MVTGIIVLAFIAGYWFGNYIPVDLFKPTFNDDAFSKSD